MRHAQAGLIPTALFTLISGTAGQAQGLPPLPDGLGGGGSAPPPLPIEIVDEPVAAADPLGGITFTGFAEVRAGTRTNDTALHGDETLQEARLHVDAEAGVAVTARLSFDLVADALADGETQDLQTGTGPFDLREASIGFSPAPFAEVKIGRQILTWGTGDMLFINDFFPKDYRSFILGRDQSYLKAPSDAAKVSLFSEVANLDIVYTPQFDADRFPDGSRLSYYDPMAGALSADPINVDRPDAAFEDDEIALRLYRTYGSYELALYRYDGFWKSPAGFDTGTGLYTFPRVSATGASVRGPLGPGIFNIEAGYHDSLDDPSGSDPNLPNSEVRWLAGYQFEIAPELTLGAQVYQEWLQDYAAYTAALAPGQPARDERRDIVSLRLSGMFLNQTVQASLFSLYSPTDEDGLIRAGVSYKLDDRWTLSGGANHFFGTSDATPYGQFRENSNVHVAARVGF
ncbi:MAG: hypothetical protein HUJ27_12210 [Rhodobacteraceae bacterium]|nr:hypothetical protein [Paracoccaceae bacterium]